MGWGSTMASEALVINATLTSPMAVPLFPINLDGLLAAMVCAKQGLVAGVGEWQDVEIPVERSVCGRYHMASVGHWVSLGSVGGYTQKRAPVTEYIKYGDSKLRTVNTAAGPNKGCRIPQPKALLEQMRWWCIGEAEAIMDLLCLVTHLAKKRSVGHGAVGKWEVTQYTKPWDGFPVMRPDGTPMRNLPLDTPGLGPETAAGVGPLTYPYWDQTRAIEVAQAPAVDWMGP